MTLELPHGFDPIPVGSRVTCDPPVLDTDEDYLCFVHPNASGTSKMLLRSMGYRLDGKSYDMDNSPFKSWKKGKINLIVTSDKYFYERFLFATEIAKERNLLDKPERIALFQYIIYGNT